MGKPAATANLTGDHVIDDNAIRTRPRRQPRYGMAAGLEETATMVSS